MSGANSWVEFLAEIIGKPVGSAILIGSGAALTGLVRRIIKRRRLRQVCRAFGSNASDPENIAICLGSWEALPSFEGEYGAPRFQKNRRDGSIDRYRGPNAVFAKCDVKAAATIATIFAKSHRQLPRFRDDETELDEDHCAVYIGSMIANEETRCRLQNDAVAKVVRFRMQQESSENKAVLLIHDAVRRLDLSSGGNVGYSVVLRLPNESGEGKSYSFFIMGAHECGTLSAARYFAIHWEKFARADDVAAIFLSNPRGSYNAQQVAAYGFHRSWWQHLRNRISAMFWPLGRSIPAQGTTES